MKNCLNSRELLNNMVDMADTQQKTDMAMSCLERLQKEVIKLISTNRIITSLIH